MEDYKKKYEKALALAKEMYKDDCETCLYCLEQLFPELAEPDDEKIRKEIITYLSTVDDKELIPYESWIAWLEKQGEQKPAEWSYKDRIHLGNCIALVQRLSECEANWLKSLEDRCVPQPHWKPTEEQMEALKLSTYCQDKKMSKILFELYKQLKAL